MPILGFLLTVVLPIFMGCMLVAPFQPFAGISGLLASGTVTGLTVFTAISFLFALYWNVSWTTILFAQVIFVLVIWLARRSVRNETSAVTMVELSDESFPVKIIRLGILLGLGVLIVLCVGRVMMIEQDGFWIGFANNLGDLPLHIHYITSFLYAENFPPVDPIFSGVPLRYPFLCDFYSALVWFATDNMQMSLELPGILLSLSFFWMLVQFTVQVTGSRLAGALTPLLFFLNGGMGWTVWIRDLIARKDGSWLFRVYTHFEQEHYEWANVIHALLIPQRSLQFAFPLVLLAIALALQSAKAKVKAPFVFLAFLLASLPYFHGHATIVLSVYFFLLFVFYPSLSWFYLFVPLLLIWTPQILYLAQVWGEPVPGSAKFIRFTTGWQVQGLGAFWFWLKNTGPFIPLALFGFLWAKKEAKMIGLAAFALFLLANFVMFAPWAWDNIKILIFWYMGALPLACLTLCQILQSKRKWLRPVGVLLVIALTLAGSLDLLRVFKTNNEHFRMLSNEEIAVGKWLRDNSPKRSVFLVNPTYNQPLVLSGRGMILGYPGHIWSHGQPNQPREWDINTMGKGLPDALSLMKRYGVTHVVYGPNEERAIYNRSFFDRNLTYMGGMNRHLLYRVP